MTTHEVILPLFQERPTPKYRTIVADPPWHYEHSWSTFRGPGKPQVVTKQSDYPTMTVDEICNLPAGLWASDNAHLYLWTTQAYIVEAHRVVKAWGFTTKNLLTWVKRKDTQDAWLGMGTYYRSVTEYVLFAVRGSLRTKEKNQANIFYGSRGQHSEKPSAFYDIVERMSPGPYLDVFSRKQRFNWDTWGNEAFDFRQHTVWNKTS